MNRGSLNSILYIEDNPGFRMAARNQGALGVIAKSFDPLPLAGQARQLGGRENG